MNSHEILSLAQEVLRIEARTLADLAQNLDQAFVQAVDCLWACQGRVVCCGMGKSGLIAKKIVATLASTGTPGFFLHPAEAIHGDLGMLMPGDCFLSLSHSGETDELLQLIPHVQALGLPHICLTGQRHSTLALHADYVLHIAVAQEASALSAVPMASTTATLAMGDALAAALMAKRGFQQEDFARNHPGGSLGRKLLSKVEAYMQPCPQVRPDLPLPQVLLAISEGRLGMVAVLDEAGSLLGVITDGDLRRALSRQPDQAFFQSRAQDLMSLEPKTINPQANLIEAEAQLNHYRIGALIVQDEEGRIVGALGKAAIR